MVAWFQIALDLFGGTSAAGRIEGVPAPQEAKPRPDPAPPRRVPARPRTGRKVGNAGPRGAALWQLPVLSAEELVAAARPVALPTPGLVTPATTPMPAPVPAPAKLAAPKETPAPNLLRHSAATHTLQLPTTHAGMVEVAYRLQRAKRRSIGFLVNEEGLSVKAPHWISLMDVAQAARDKAPWILRKLSEIQERTHRSLNNRIVWENGATLRYLGQALVITLEPSHATLSGGAQWVAPEADAGGYDTAEKAAKLLIFLPMDASAAQIRDATKAWLLRQAQQYFVERLNHFAPPLGVRWTKLTLSNAGSRWGSAKSDGSIRLHWRLMHFRPSIIDYVVVHELSHLRVMDHSPRFWGTVATLVPDYAAQRQLLKTEPLGDWT